MVLVEELPREGTDFRRAASQDLVDEPVQQLRRRRRLEQRGQPARTMRRDEQTARAPSRPFEAEPREPAQLFGAVEEDDVAVAERRENLLQELRLERGMILVQAKVADAVSAVAQPRRQVLQQR